MKKQSIFCFLALGMLVALPCKAETIYSDPVFLSDGYVRIEGVSDTANSPITFRAAKTEETPEYVAILETLSDADGKFEFLFGIPDSSDEKSANGEYIVYIKAQGEERKEFTFKYIDFRYLLNKIRAVKNGNELYTVISECDDYDKEALSAMGIAVQELWAVKSDIKNIAETVFNTCDLSEAELDEIAKAFNNSTGLAYAKNADTETALKLINPSYNETEFNSAENQQDIINVMNVNMDSDSLDAFIGSYELSNKIIEFRTLRSALITEAVNTYDKYFKFSQSSKYTAYEGMSIANKGRTADKMSEYLGSGISRVSEIINAFEQAVSYVENNSYSNYGGGGGGASSGGNMNKSTGVYSSGSTDSEYKIGATTLQSNSTFTDLNGVEWAQEAITALFKKGIVSGTDNKSFNPNGNVKREEFVKMIVLACGLYNVDAQCDFEDVNKNEWYYPYIASAVNKEIINGTDENRFGTSLQITREDMAVIVKRAANAAGIEFKAIKTAEDFVDSDIISDYAEESIRELYCAGIIAGMGDNTFNPKGSSTRAQAAKIIYEAFVK